MIPIEPARRRRLGLIYNPHKRRAEDLARDLGEELTARGDQVVAVTGDATEMAPVDVLVVLGGDGTFLRGVRLVGDRGTPILGVDLGTLGFLSEVGADAVLPALERFFDGTAALEERAMLEVALHRGGEVVDVQHALNEGVVNKGAGSKLLEFSVYAGDSLVAAYGADGLVVATPTGSTAYALSAGGPIMAPDVPAFVLTPICPHSLSIRPLVVSQRKRIRVVVNACVEGAVLAVDGHVGCPIVPGDEVLFHPSSRTTRMVKVTDADFFGRLRTKFQWGTRPPGA